MSTAAVRPAPSLPWLFSAPVDLAVFLGSALLALALVAIGLHTGWTRADAPEWTWITAVLLIDVAHVYATGFRVYFDPAELRRRPVLYSIVPLLGLSGGIALYAALGNLIFWRVLAYLAVFHFVRQQYGWVALYRARAGERDRVGWWIDTAAVYMATIYPLIYWHTHLPREFRWFIKDDFTSVPDVLEAVAAPIYWLSLGAYAGRSLLRGLLRGQWNPGKDIIVATTAVCWYAGIVALNSDFAFTVTNVIIHGVPYLALVYWYHSHRRQDRPRQPLDRLRTLGIFLATLWLLAYVEEMFWDRCVWQEHATLFGTPWHMGSWNTIIVPLLAVPQFTHYVLDGFIWKRRTNPELATLISSRSDG
jgi:hypothetical protein